MKHFATLTKKPLATVVSCRCGWVKTVSAPRNALGRNSKAMALARAHDKLNEDQP
jgi:hypothetical protein